jgi:hypothetical protein
MDMLQQVLAALYVSICEACGGAQVRLAANQVLRDAIDDGAVDDPAAILLLESIAAEPDDADNIERPGPIQWLHGLDLAQLRTEAAH